MLGPNNRPGYAGPGGSNLGRFNTMGKSVEVQRSQVDELFKSMKDGDELPETEARTSAHSCLRKCDVIQVTNAPSEIAPELATTLYPHQKKALTFMLERELERTGATNPSLWQERYNPISRERSWFHLITQREVFEPPPPTKGAILADDVSECIGHMYGLLTRRSDGTWKNHFMCSVTCRNVPVRSHLFGYADGTPATASTA